MLLNRIDAKVIRSFRRVSEPIARYGFFIFFFWFGALKVLGMSPSSELVQILFEDALPQFSPFIFIALLGIFEIVVGLLFLVKGNEGEVIPLLFIDLIVVSLPLFLLSSETWSGIMVPTIDGQYIIANLILIVFAVGMASYFHPLPSESKWD